MKKVKQADVLGCAQSEALSWIGFRKLGKEKTFEQRPT